LNRGKRSKRKGSEVIAIDEVEMEGEDEVESPVFAVL
jgi:hypothetical protein